jgi:hypothetical protein
MEKNSTHSIDKRYDENTIVNCGVKEKEIKNEDQREEERKEN